MRVSPVRRVVELLVYGEEPVGAADALALHSAQVVELSGVPTGPRPNFGIDGTPATSWGGWTVSPQGFQGRVQLQQGEAVVSTYPALPSTTTPPAMPAWLAAQAGLEGQGTGG